MNFWKSLPILLSRENKGNKILRIDEILNSSKSELEVMTKLNPKGYSDS